MPAAQSALSYDVFVAPEKPFVAPPPAVGDSPAWDPTTSTLIFGARDAVLVDPLMTVREPDQELFDAMVHRYPDWVSRQQFLILGL